MPVLILLSGLGLAVSGDTPTPSPEDDTPSGGGPIGGPLMRRKRGPMIDLELWAYSIRKEEEEYLLTR